MITLILLLASLAQDTLVQADAALARGDYDAAIAQYRAVLQAEPASAPARLGLARALSFSNRRSEAIAEYTRLLADHPDHVDALLARGRVLAWEKNYPEALADLRRVTTLKPDYADAWSALGDALRWSGETAEAVEAYGTWVGLQPDRPEPYLARAQALQDLNRFDEARADLHAARDHGAAAADVDDRLAAVARAPGALPWEVAVRYSVRTFESQRTPWQEIHTTLSRDFDFGSLSLDAVRVRRFSRWDDAVAAESYVDLWKSAYVDLRLQHAPSPQVLPRWDGMAELYQGLGAGWEVSGMYRRIVFPGDATDVYGGSVGKYLGLWYLRARVTAVPSGGTTDLSAALWVRRYVGNEDHYAEFGIGRGESTIDTGVAQRILRHNTFFAQLRGESKLSAHWAASWGVGLEREKAVPDSWTFSAGLKFRW